MTASSSPKLYAGRSVFQWAVIGGIIAVGLYAAFIW